MARTKLRSGPLPDEDDSLLQSANYFLSYAYMYEYTLKKFQHGPVVSVTALRQAFRDLPECNNQVGKDIAFSFSTMKNVDRIQK